MEYLKQQLLIIAIALFCFDADAQSNFYKTYVGSAFDTGEGMTQLPDSSFAVTGGSGAFSVNSGQAYLMLVDSLGDHLWTKNYGGNGSDWGRRVFHKPGTGFMIAGTTNTTSEGQYNFYVITTDEDGNLLTEKNFGTQNWEQMWDACLLDDGGLLMVGETEGETTSQKDIYIARVDDTGDTLWTQTIESGEDDVAYAVDTLNDTTVVIGGHSWDGSMSNAVLISMHINGTENWRTFYGNPAMTNINDIQVYNGEIFCGGGIIQDGETDSDWWLLNTDDQGNQLGTATFDYNGEDMLTQIAIVDDDNLFMGLKSNSTDLNVFSNGSDAFVLKFHTDLYFNGFSKGFSGVNPDAIHDLFPTIEEGAAFVGTCGANRTEPSLSEAIMIAKIGPDDQVPNDADVNNDMVSVHEESIFKKIRVYPNPSSDMIFISGNENSLDVEIYSLEGQLVFAGANKNKVDISNFHDGVYLLHLIDGEHRVVQRIIKR